MYRSNCTLLSFCFILAAGCSAVRDNSSDPKSPDYVPSFQAPANLSVSPRTGNGTIGANTTLSWQSLASPDVSGYYYKIDITPTDAAPGTFTAESSMTVTGLSNGLHNVFIHAVYGAISGRQLVNASKYATITFNYNAGVDFTGPVFTGITANPDPPSSTIAVSFFSFNFNKTLDSSTATSNATVSNPFSNICVGNIQFSRDDFSSCLAIIMTANTTNFYTTFNAGTLQAGVTYKYRLLKTITDEWGNLMAADITGSFVAQ